MACGLGAVALIFLLIKHNVNKPDDTIASHTDLRPQLEALIKEEKKLVIEEEKLQKTIDLKFLKNKELTQQLSDYNEIKKSIKDNIDSNTAKNKNLENEISNIEVPKDIDRVELKGSGEQDFLIGLKIKGKKIVLILDISSSMTDEALIDIISRMGSSEEEVKQGPKWKRTLRIVRWILARLPRESQLSIITFSGKAEYLDNKKWYNSDLKDIKTITDNIDRIVPSGATNLSSALKLASNLRPSPDEMYLVTDGLPTKGFKEYSNLDVFSNCGSVLSRAKKISGECRVKLFWQAVNELNKNTKNIQTNVILLPLEGDPQAAPNYWLWTANKRGILLVPSKDWP